MNFKFQIGSLVAFKSAVALLDIGKKGAFVYNRPMPRSFMVLETLTQTCPGGTQLHYALSDGGEHIRALEVELVSWDEAVPLINAQLSQ